MYAVVITDEGGVRRRLDFSKPEVTVGRVQGNDIVLAKRNVSKQHARLSLMGERAVVVDLNSTNGTWVNGRKITSPHPLKSGDKIYIANFIITLESGENDQPESSAEGSLSEPPPLPSKSSMPPNASIPIKSSIPVRTSSPFRSSRASRARSGQASEILKTSLPPRIERRQTDEAVLSKKHEPTDEPAAALMSRLADRIDVEALDPASMKDQERWSAARAAIAETFLTMQTDGSVNAEVDMRQVAHIALHEAVGLGALDDVLSNDAVQMVVVNGPKRVLIDTGAGMRSTALSFSSSRALQVVAHRLAAQTGRALENQPVFHGRLSFGPRVTILQAPLVAHGPVIEIRVGRAVSLDKLAEEGWMSADAAAYLTKAVAECRNIVVVGPQGSGVTTLLSAIAQQLPEEENTVVIEAIPDLDVDREKVIALTAAEAGMSMVDAINQGARLRADHVIMNDLTGADSVGALAAVSGRDPGHLLGVHCSSTKDAIEGLVLAASCGGANRSCIAELVGSTVHAVVAVARGSDGSRVTAIHEVEGHEAGDVSYQSVPF
ncbi:MAG: ATPase, T2SS/T4P/T4SS family [Myxococcales bacterium]|nr:ATPase, T2SS/T4P/T4SS family [Myxococcales bacterium]